MRDGFCEVESGHRGRCSTVAFYCDGCGRQCRGQPHATHQDLQSDGNYEPVADFCFMCTRGLRGKESYEES